MKFDISKSLNNIFYVDKLCLVNVDSFLSQPINNMQFFSIQEDRKERFVIEDIITEIKNKKRRR